jgi:hypothetical protein
VTQILIISPAVNPVPEKVTLAPGFAADVPGGKPGGTVPELVDEVEPDGAPVAAVVAIGVETGEVGTAEVGADAAGGVVPVPTAYCPTYSVPDVFPCAVTCHIPADGNETLIANPPFPSACVPSSGTELPSGDVAQSESGSFAWKPCPENVTYVPTATCCTVPDDPGAAAAKSGTRNAIIRMIVQAANSHLRVSRR